MKTFLLTVFSVLSLSLFSQNDGVIIDIELLNAPTESVDGTITFMGEGSFVSYSLTILGSSFSQYYPNQSIEWNTGQISLADCDGDSLTGYFSNNDSISYFNYSFVYCQSDSIFGCTNPTALNYQPEANVDDGSCIYEGVENDLCENAIPLEIGSTLIDNSFTPLNEGITGECWNFGSGEGEQSSLWYSFTTPALPAEISIEAVSDGSNTLTDTQFGLFSECGGEMIYCDGNSGQGLLSAFDFSCGELDTSTTYILIVDGWNGDAGTCFLNYEISSPCGNEILGCTDPEAINYNPAATINDGSCEYEACENNEVIILINTENWGYEISWNIRNEAGEEVAGSGEYPNYTTITELACLEDGCYSFELFDSYGDGWNGGTFDILLNDTILASGTLETGEYASVAFGINTVGCQEDEISGCTDPEATNFNPEATTDDGSCVYSECDNNAVTILINTENWGYEISWNIINEAGEEVAGSGDYPNYSTITELACLEDGCYALELFDSYGDGWNGGTFDILLNDTILASGTLETGEYASIAFGINTVGCQEDEISGCTDPEAVNYNPEATTDDGSCEYSCTEISLGFDFDTYPNDSSYANMYWVITNQENGEVQSQSWYNWAPQYDNICLESGCFTFEVFNVPSEWNGFYFIYSDNLSITQGEFSGEENTFSITFGLNAEGCDENEDVYGCTDPDALNYNPEATLDDGSCNYGFECGISFAAIADSSGENMFYIIPSDNIVNASAVLWDFGDGSTSSEFYPTHVYESDGPFTLCLFVTFEDDNGNYCEISYCEVLNGTTIGGSGVLSGGFMINIIQPGTLSDNVGLAEKELAIYPNPTNGITTISYLSDQSEKLTLRVSDLTGKVLEQRVLSSSIGQQRVEVDLSEFPKGLYLIGLEQNNSRSYAKVVRR